LYSPPLAPIADYVQRFARPEAMLGRNGNNHSTRGGKDSEEDGDDKMDERGGGEGKGNESEGFLSSSSDEES